MTSPTAVFIFATASSVSQCWPQESSRENAPSVRVLETRGPGQTHSDTSLTILQRAGIFNIEIGTACLDVARLNECHHFICGLKLAYWVGF